MQRAVFLMRDVFDYSILETARLLHLTQGAVKAALHRARTALVRVKQDLEAETFSAAESSENHSAYRIVLRNMAAACQNGDIAKVIALALHNEAEPVAAYVLATSIDALMKRRKSTYVKGSNGIHMCAVA